MKYKLGIFGSSSGDMNQALAKAEELGRVLGQHLESVIAITGACTGLPYMAASTASKMGVEVWGFAPTVSEEEWHRTYPDDDIDVYTKITYVPDDFPFANHMRICQKYRNVISTATCDAGIILAGRWGTLNEYTNLVDFQKTIGVLTATGGIADELPTLSSKIHKKGQGEVLFNDDPGLLVEAILERLKAKNI